MADTFQMRENRHPRFALHQPDQPLAATRHDHVNMLDHAQHIRHGGAVGGLNKLDRILWQPARAQPRNKRRVNGARGLRAFGPTTQNNGIPSLQAQGPGIGGHIGARFIDHPDHAQRRAHALNMQTGGAVPFGHDLPDRVVLGSNRAQRGADTVYPRTVQQQPVQHGGRQPLLLPCGHIQRHSPPAHRRAWRPARRQRPSAPVSWPVARALANTLAAARARAPICNISWLISVIAPSRLCESGPRGPDGSGLSLSRSNGGPRWRAPQRRHSLPAQGPAAPLAPRC